MSTQLYTTTTEIVEDFVIDPNPLFNKISNETITKLENLPNQVNYKRIESKGDQFRWNFNENINEKSFLDCGITVYCKIPVKFVLSTPYTADITSTNYMTAMNNFENVCLRQYGLINAIRDVSLSINNNTIHSINNMAPVFNMISQYWSDEDLNERFEASMPDKYYTYELYKSASKSYETVDDGTNKINFPMSVMESSNPFTGSHDSRYNTRKIAFTHDGKATAGNKTEVKGYITLSTPIPFSLFTLPGSTDALYGIKNFDLNVNLFNDYVGRLFSVSKNAGVDFISSIELDASLTGGQTYCLVRHFASSQIITNDLASTNNVIDPFRVGYTSIQSFNPLLIDVPSTDVWTSKAFNSSQITLTAVPKSFYVGIKLKTAKDKKIFNTPDIYARLQSLDIMNNVGNTIISAGNDARILYQFAKGNGLNRDVETSLRGCMYALKINSADIGWDNDTYVGELKSFNITVNGTFLAPVEGQYELIVVAAHQNSVVQKDGEFIVVHGLIANSGEFKKENFIGTDGYVKKMTIVGGFGFGDVLNLGKKVGRYLANNHKDIREGITSQWKKFQASGNIIGGNTTTMGAGNYNKPVKAGASISSFKLK